MKEKLTTLCYEGVSVLVMASIIIAIIFTFVTRFVGVIGSSMNPTLVSGDWVLVDQSYANYKPGYGDVVVIAQPNELEENIIKRVIATEGQTVDINFETGAVYINGNEIYEKYINNATTNHYDVEFPVTVPDGMCFVMGDNRQGSIDSRSTIIGFIDNRYVLGKATTALTDDGFTSLDLRKSK
ncbi:MAG: signal peptidase I [Clostridia bacterium]|nr:signal peptidase I [Clostridia bacterium]